MPVISRVRGEGDAPELAERARPVHPRRVVKLLRDLLDRDGEEERRIAEALPLAHGDDGIDRRPRIAEPDMRPFLQVQGLQQPVEDADVGLIDEIEEEPGDGRRDGRGHEIERPPEVAPAFRGQALDDGGEAEGREDLEEDGEHRIGAVVPERAAHHRVLREPAVIVEPDLRHLAGEDVLVRGADEEVVDDRVIDEPAHKDERHDDPAQRQQPGEEGAQPRPPPCPVGGAAEGDPALSDVRGQAHHLAAAAAARTSATTSSAVRLPPAKACRFDSHAAATRGWFTVSSHCIR